MWNVRCVGCCNFVPTNLRFFLATESVSAVVLPAFEIVNSGSLGLGDLWCYIAFIAMIGHMTELPKDGMAIVLVSVLF